MMSDALINYPSFKKSPKNDYHIAKSIHRLLDECDIAIAHNGDNFDFKRLNTFFVKNKLKPTSPFKTIDTKKASRGNFGFISNKLDSLCRELEIGAKLQHSGMKLWTDCMEGCPRAWNQMIKYNKQDVRLLEELYLTLRPYIKNHPDLKIYNQPNGKCSACGGKNIGNRGSYLKRGGRFRRYQCLDCGFWGTGEKVV